MPYLTNIRTGLFGAPDSLTCPPSRIILEATAPLSYSITENKNKKILTLPGTILNMPAGIINVFDGMIGTVSVTTDTAGSPQVIINTIDESTCAISEISGLPHRLLIDLDRSPLQRHLHNHRILIDPARDEKEKEAVSPTGLPEHIPTLDIARRLAQLLAQVPAHVNLTRMDTLFVPVASRIQLCKELKPTLFLSIATRVEKRKPRSGFQIKYYYGKQENQLLAAYLDRELQRKVSIPSHGTEPVNLTLLREIPIPGALVETACISHRLDEGLLRDVDFRQLVAQALFNGILAYCSKI